MVQMNRALSSKPDMILLEVNPISLSQVSDILNKYSIKVDARITLLERGEYIGWVEIENEHLDYMDYYFDDRLNLKTGSLENQLKSLLNRYKNNNSR